MKVKNTPLKPEDYFPRLSDRMLPSLLNSYKILEFEGVRGCGKTYTCLSVAQTITHADEKSIVLPLIQSDPRLAISGARPHVIDEWKTMPELQELAYREAEATGSMLLTTSLRPGSPEPYVRSHASAASHIRMRTLSLFELGLSNASVSLAGLLDGRFDPMAKNVSIGTIASYICKGGWPFAREADSAQALELAGRHVGDILATDVTAMGKKPSTAQDVLAATAGCEGDFTYARIAQAMKAHGAKMPSRNTLTAYLGVLEQLYLVERLNGWAAPVRATSRVKVKPRYLPCDPSVGVFACGLNERDLLRDASIFSRALKSMAFRDLLVYASALEPGVEPQVRYYADSDGLAVDFVLLLADGRWAAINVEIGEAQTKDSIKRLQRLCKKVRNGGQLQDPAFCAVILAGTNRPRRDEATGTYVFPITAFGA